MNNFFGALTLPENWVYVIYENGQTENVSNCDTLSENEALEFKKTWESRGAIKAVELRKADKKSVLKRFDF